MTKLEVFDPAMCCSTGVCGTQVDPALARFEADLRWLGGRGADVTRYNLGQEPGAFAGSDVVRAVLQAGGEGVLPVVLVDGKLKWTGHYPTRDELAGTLPATAATAPADQGCCGPAEQAADGAGDACCAPTLHIGSAPAAASSGGCCS
jgi:Arsenical resistance operon protein ArsD